MDLTVVVCTIPERAQLLTRCLYYLEHQTRQDFTSLICHGDKPKGVKLNRAFNLVETSHVMVLDDDDWLSERHMENVLPLLDVDFVGYDAVQMVVGRFAQIIHQETASHICPTRTELARSIPFGDEYLADVKWTKKVAPLVETETYIDDQLYFYDKWNPPGTTGWSPPRPVGWWPHNKAAHYWL